jgi:hypothetical protein
VQVCLPKLLNLKPEQKQLQVGLTVAQTKRKPFGMEHNAHVQKLLRWAVNLLLLPRQARLYLKQI